MRQLYRLFWGHREDMFPHSPTSAFLPFVKSAVLHHSGGEVFLKSFKKGTCHWSNWLNEYLRFHMCSLHLKWQNIILEFKCGKANVKMFFQSAQVMQFKYRDSGVKWNQNLSLFCKRWGARNMLSSLWMYYRNMKLDYKDGGHSFERKLLTECITQLFTNFSTSHKRYIGMTWRAIQTSIYVLSIVL